MCTYWDAFHASAKIFLVLLNWSVRGQLLLIGRCAYINLENHRKLHKLTEFLAGEALFIKIRVATKSKKSFENEPLNRERVIVAGHSDVVEGVC